MVLQCRFGRLHDATCHAGYIGQVHNSLLPAVQNATSCPT